MIFICYVYGDLRDLHVRTHSFPTRRSSDLDAELVGDLVQHAEPAADGVGRDLPGQREHLGAAAIGGRQRCAGVEDRSEEHTSELQSLMRISYAVFCLKKKQTLKRQQHEF